MGQRGVKDRSSQVEHAGRGSQPLTGQTPTPVFLGFSMSNVKYKVLPDKLATVIEKKLSTSFSSDAHSEKKWFLLYNSNIHGKSFQSMIQRIMEKGPTLLLVKIKDCNTIVGGYCESNWLTVAARERQAKSISAAKTRSLREGQQSCIPSRPLNQNPLFFGSENCFLFTASTDTNGNLPIAIDFYSSHPTVNCNFMYLFDTHPLEEKIGIGMGGQPGYFGLFLDRWLDEGFCFGERCSTFQCPRLSLTEVWQIESVEVYSVGPQMVEQLLHNNSDRVNDSSLLRNPDSAADKLLLELHGVHKFDVCERPDC